MAACSKLSSVSWILAGLAAIPYLLFTTITLMVDDPPGSKNFIEESAICVLLPTNITPQVRQGKRNLRYANFVKQQQGRARQNS